MNSKNLRLLLLNDPWNRIADRLYSKRLSGCSGLDVGLDGVGSGVRVNRQEDASGLDVDVVSIDVGELNGVAMGLSHKRLESREGVHRYDSTAFSGTHSGVLILDILMGH